jgi:hypothetical protein
MNLLKHFLMQLLMILLTILLNPERAAVKAETYDEL